MLITVHSDTLQKYKKEFKSHIPSPRIIMVSMLVCINKDSFSRAHTHMCARFP